MRGQGLSSRCATLVLTFNSRAQGDFQARECVQLKVVKRQLMFSKIVLKYHPPVEPSGPAGVAEAGGAAVATPAAL